MFTCGAVQNNMQTWAAVFLNTLCLAGERALAFMLLLAHPLHLHSYSAPLPGAAGSL